MFFAVYHKRWIYTLLNGSNGLLSHRFSTTRLDKLHRYRHNALMSDTQPPFQMNAYNTTCFVRSYAKINLTLDVLGKRSDGYHELATIMQMVDLYDTLCLTLINTNEVTIASTRTELNSSDNLAVRAAQAIRTHFSLRQGVNIELHKRIPMAAGLGGGSSNAAAVLLALRAWWQLPLPDEDLLMLAATLGSDVPFFLTKGLALCKGRGEILTPLPTYWPASMRWLLLIKPQISVSTADVFRHLPVNDYTDGVHTQAVYTVLLAKGEPLREDVYNGLERGVMARYPEVAQAHEAILNAGASFVRLSGSGPTLFAPFAELTCAEQVRQRLHMQGYEVYLTRAIHPVDGNIEVL